MKDDTVKDVLASLDFARSAPDMHGLSLPTPAVRAVSKQQYEPLKLANKKQVFDCCAALLETRDNDARLIAFDWAFRLRKQYEASDFGRFERWLQEYVDGWGSCDDFCTHAFGALVYQFPGLFPGVRDWTPSVNRWLRRAAAVVLIYAVRRDALINESFEIADRLLMDEDDLVRKGYGWLLKEVSNRNPQVVFDYVMRHKDSMPRVSLRYAVEKLDPELRRQAMAK